MNISCIPVPELTDEQFAAWRRIHDKERQFTSPFFAPELVQQTAKVRDCVEVGILADGDNAIGFFPFHRHRPHVAKPFAAHMTNMQAVITRHDCRWSSDELLAGCGLRVWNFDHLLAGQGPDRRRFEWATFEAPYMDLREGFEAYRRQRRKSGTKELQEALRKLRKIQRDCGELRFEPYCSDPGVLQQLLQWKADQMRRRKMWNGLSVDWVPELLENLLHVQTERFSGMLSALFINDQLLAATMGIRSRTVLHGWVTAFNPDYHKYSPGRLLIVQLAQQCEQLGIERIDMGRGEESFKQSFGSGVVTLAEGAIDQRWLTRSLRKGWVRVREGVRKSPLGDPARRFMSRMRYAFR